MQDLDETAELLILCLRSYLSPALRGQKFSSLGEVKSFLECCSLQGAARCAFELALIDAATRRLGESAHAVIGPARRSRVHYTAVVPAVSLQWLKCIAIAVRVLGFPAAKIKVGTLNSSRMELPRFGSTALSLPMALKDPSTR
jgi:L-alanine-DL-glutamate epimerase-like enolase superfamily enzyme